MDYNVLNDGYKNELLSIIKKHLPGCKVYLFGSRATGKNKPGSDIDLALDSGSIIDYRTILAILCDIDESSLPMKVDIVDLHTVGQSLKQDVLTEGMLWTK